MGPGSGVVAGGAIVAHPSTCGLLMQKTSGVTPVWQARHVAVMAWQHTGWVDDGQVGNGPENGPVWGTPFDESNGPVGQPAGM